MMLPFRQCQPFGICAQLLLAGLLHGCCCGDSDEETRSSESNWVSVASGSSHSCGLRIDVSVECWGCRESDSGIPRDHGQCDAPSGRFKAVSASSHSSCAIGMDGTVTCWGHEKDEVPSVEDCQLLRAGDWASFAMDRNGVVHHWDCLEEDPANCSAPPNPLYDISVGMVHACGLDAHGAAVCWGCTMGGINQGQCNPPRVKFSAIDSFQMTTCGVRSDGNIECWGQFSGVVSGNFVDLDIGGKSCGIQADNTLRCWDYVPSTPSDPFEKPLFFQTVSGDYLHACGVTKDGSVICWGRNSSGQLDVP